MQYCKCEGFKEALGSQIQTQGEEMTKPKASSKQKSEGRTPTLAPFVKEGFNIFAGRDGKYEARVRADGIIVFRDKEYTSPSSAGSKALGNDDKGKPRQVDGWKFWRFKKNGEEVELNVLRGSKSPLAASDAAPRKLKAAKKRAPHKPRAASPVPATQTTAAAS